MRNAFALKPDSIISYAEHRGNSVIPSHRFKYQMSGGIVMILGVISSFDNLGVKTMESKYNSLKYFDELQTTFILWCLWQFGQKKWIRGKTLRVSKLQKKKSWNKMAVFTWPARKSDLNIIENMWPLMEEVVYSDKQCNDRKKLIHALERCQRSSIKKS